MISFPNLFDRNAKNATLLCTYTYAFFMYIPIFQNPIISMDFKDTNLTMITSPHKDTLVSAH